MTGRHQFRACVRSTGWRLILGLLLLLLPSSAHAEDWSVEAGIDATHASTDDILIYTISVIGTGPGTAVLESEPNIADFTEMGRSTQDRIVNHQGHSSKSKEMIFRLKPKRAGRLVVGPATIRAGQHFYETDAIEIDVVDTSANSGWGLSPPVGGGSGGGGSGGGPGGSGPGGTGVGGTGTGAGTPLPSRTYPKPKVGDPYFVELRVESPEVYLGQPFFLHYDLYVKADRPSEMYDVTDPDFPPGLLTREPDQPSYGIHNETRDGIRYRVEEKIRSYILQPIELGEVVLSPLAVEVPRGVFSSPRDWISSPSDQVFVKPLPPNPPKGFVVGNVGRHLALDATLRASGVGTLSDLKVGDSVVLMVKLEGEGFVDQMSLGPIAQQSWVQSFGPEVLSDEIEVDFTQIRGVRRFRLTLVMMEEGEFEIPPVTFDYFDLDGARYSQEQVGPWSVKVEGFGPNADAILEQAAARREAELDEAVERPEFEALPGLRALSPDAPPATAPYTRWWFALLMAVAPLTFGGSLAVTAWSQRRAKGAEQRRMDGAHKQAKRALRAVGKELGARTVCSSLSAVLREYLIERYEIRARSATAASLERLLAGAGVAEELRASVAALLTELESMSYSPEGVSQPASAALLDSVNDALDELESARKGARR